MQAALMLRSKSRERRKQRLKRGIKHDLPSNIATKSIAPFPRYPPASWCAAGRAAWQEAAALSVGGGGAGAGGAARRCSVLGDHPGARRDQRGKWHRNNRVRTLYSMYQNERQRKRPMAEGGGTVGGRGRRGRGRRGASLLRARRPPRRAPRPARQVAQEQPVYNVFCDLCFQVRDASYGSSSDSDGEAEGGHGEPWGVARLLYAGLGTLAVGLVVYFVGTGDKGFKTPALRLVGPSLIIAGLACCLLRIAFCIFAKPCCRRRTNYKESRRLSGGEGEEMPLAGGASARAGPAQCSPARRLDASSCDVSSLSSGEEDERLRRYRTAAAPPPVPHAPPAPLPPAPPPVTAQPAPPSRRPPPRNVSFAGPNNEGELVLSPAQLRS
ncbi:uncharacterized protein LOC134667781 [Cydia fagiglandana]|uniref:uncharacterized protein LOC134667781 n=1 Tax=Cydia fagiglandana TaxID=1458189 RepID=UPI002FEE14AF